MNDRKFNNLNGQWEIPPNLDTSLFDFDWKPALSDPPFIHEFGTQWQKTGGPRYVVDGATGVKYVDTQRAIKLADSRDRSWRGCEHSVFDYSWHPDSTDPPYIYQFGNQWKSTDGPRYVVAGAKQVKYMDYPVAKRLPNMDNWTILHQDIDNSTFDYSWYPDHDDPYQHVFGSPYYPVEEMPCLIYRNHRESQSPVKYHSSPTVQLKPIDIVFMSNGESGEQERYNLLCQYANQYTKREVKWVRGVNGRENAIKRCATISSTEWVLVFPAKLKVYPDFDFNWQPRRGTPRHYIFYAHNPVNGLCYGHMAPVAYHCDTAINLQEYGLDYTMSAPHDIVPISAGVAEYNADPLIAWRTAFREAIKLKVSADSGDTESHERLDIWLTRGTGINAEYSISGAGAGVEYYNSVQGALDKLQQSFSWDWMNKMYYSAYKNSQILL